ncbi:hypothetical protein [Mycetocola miduiensis]|uniref:Uncharacterized protein n=1 Tax=Mycetocola miduiensis TaxID=995034 RepID=A0A1I5ABC6_9MICO|nr:hypothetical protein [Mycetocola miduiensis]SFN59650.1 hypothetical protein SAMN05216219_1312 [Mycetocola miduiensis]
MAERGTSPSRPPGTPPARGDDGIRPLTKAVSVFVLPFLTAAVLLLYFFPGDTEQLFAWTIQPPLTAMVLASAYAGGIWFFVQVLRQDRWHRVRHGFPGALLFATLLAVATVLHWDRFHFGHISFITWATLYLVTPILLLAVLIVNWRADRGRPDAIDTTIPWPARILLALFGVAALVTGLVLFIVPTVAVGSWAWDVTPLTARVIGTVLTLPGTVHLWLLLDSRWSAFRWVFQAQLVSLIFLNLALILCREQLLWENLVTLPVVATLVLAPVAYVLLYVYCERRARRNRDAGAL